MAHLLGIDITPHLAGLAGFQYEDERGAARLHEPPARHDERKEEEDERETVERHDPEHGDRPVPPPLSSSTE